MAHQAAAGKAMYVDVTGRCSFSDKYIKRGAHAADAVAIVQAKIEKEKRYPDVGGLHITCAAGERPLRR